MDMEEIEKYRDKKIGLAANIEFFKLERKFFERLAGKKARRIRMPVALIDNQPTNYYYRDG